MPDDGLICAGAGPIARFLGVKTGQVYYWASNGYLPTFRIGTTLCADKAALRNFIAEKMNKTAMPEKAA